MSLKHIVLTGASSGLGKALAIEYAEKDAVLGLIGRDIERLQEAGRLCEAKGARILIGILDVRDAEAMESWLDNFDDHYPIDLIIANAGISGGPGVMNGEDPTQVKNIFDVNVYGVMNTIHPVIRRMQARRKGQIGIVSSIAGFRGSSTAPAYSASKATVRYYGQALYALLKKDDVHVSVICPGFIETNMTAINPFPMPFLMKANKAAKIIRTGLEKRCYMIAFPWPMVWAAKIQNLLPDVIINKIYDRLPSKPSN